MKHFIKSHNILQTLELSEHIRHNGLLGTQTIFEKIEGSQVRHLVRKKWLS